MTSKSPPLDILVRTSGVKRLSDFLLWQVILSLNVFFTFVHIYRFQCCENTQIQFSNTFWPDFGLFDFVPILLDYQWKVWRTSIL